MNTTRRAEIDVDVTRIFDGSENDFPLLPNDVLHVSRSHKRAIWVSLGQIALPIIPYLIFAGTR
jgi:hypothetical protein